MLPNQVFQMSSFIQYVFSCICWFPHFHGPSLFYFHLSLINFEFSFLWITGSKVLCTTPVESLRRRLTSRFHTYVFLPCPFSLGSWSVHGPPLEDEESDRKKRTRTSFSLLVPPLPQQHYWWNMKSLRSHVVTVVLLVRCSSVVRFGFWDWDDFLWSFLTNVHFSSKPDSNFWIKLQTI